MEDYNDIDTKALAYAQRREGRCLGKVSPNTYLWSCKKDHQWEAPYKNMKQNYRWCNICQKEHADGYNEELGLVFEYSGNQHYQIVPFFHLQGQMNLDAQIYCDWEKRALCYREG
ncbi:hypothetical protein RhiirC2_798973, partial [Rhizophagus irregularis]